jgi:hypothetical protein
MGNLQCLHVTAVELVERQDGSTELPDLSR